MRRVLIVNGWIIALALLTSCPGCGMLGSSGRPPDPAQFVGKQPPMTLLLAEYHGPDAKATAERVLAELREKGFPKTYVVADNDEAYLCHGRYDGFDDPSYRKDKERIATVIDASGKSVFGWAMASPLPEPNPPTPYDLLEATGKYTVQVATFDMYGRKQDAIDYTAELRRRGYQAWTYHGNTQSLVTIGTFDDRIFDNPYRSNNLVDPRQIISPEFLKILKDFKYLNWNGHHFTDEEVQSMTVDRKVIDPRTGQPDTIKTKMGELVRSKLVHIPTEPVQRNFGGARITPPPPPPPPGPILSPKH